MECPFCARLSQLEQLPPDELLWQFPASVALLGPWQHYQGYCVLVLRHHESELFHLPDEERQRYFEEMCLLARAVADCFQPLKLNYELLGNQVPHLHWHLFPRFADDPDRLQPVWLALQRAETDAAERQRLQTGTRSRADIAAKLRQRLQELTKAS